MGTRVGSASENLPATDPPAVVHRDIVHASPYDMQRHWLAETVSRLNNCRILKRHIHQLCPSLAYYRWAFGVTAGW